MAIYYSLYILLILGAVLQKGLFKSEKGTRNYCVFAFILIAGLLAFRHPSMGVDLKYGETSGYLGTYQAIAKSSWDKVLHLDFKNYERGYVIFCKLISYISRDEQCLLIVCALVSIFPLSYLICKYSENCLLSFVIYLGLPVFLTNYSAMRQVIAIAITAFSYIFIRNKKPVLFILTVLLASAFHSSAILFLVAYVLYYSGLMKRYRIASILILPLVFLFRNPLFGILSKLLKDNAVPDNNSAVTLFIVFTAVYIFTIIYSNKDDVHEEGLKNLFWLACVCLAFGGVYSIAIRVGYYFMIYLVLLLPKTVPNINLKANDDNNTETVFYIIIMICFAVFGLYSIRNGTWAMSYPYSFFWQV